MYKAVATKLVFRIINKKINIGIMKNEYLT